jgi:hypothetical protein
MQVMMSKFSLQIPTLPEIIILVLLVLFFCTLVGTAYHQHTKLVKCEETCKPFVTLNCESDYAVCDGFDGGVVKYIP